MRLFFLLLLTQILPAQQIRVATYNAAFDLAAERELAASLRDGTNFHARRVAEIIQIIQPDVLLLNEFDYDAAGTAAGRLNDKFFNVSQGAGRTAQNYPYRYVAISNTGIHTGLDLDNNSIVNDTPGNEIYGGDCLGYGEFPGKYAMAVFSKFPIDLAGVRTFETILWKDQPGALIPPGYYSEEELAIFRLSSKSHWDVPIDVDGRAFHFLVSHPTPPVFDGAEDRNGRRNHDEIRLWADYVTPGASGYLGGGLAEGSRFVMTGDQNADPTRGDSVNAAINQLLNHPRVDSSFVPVRTGTPSGAARFDTATFNLRVDYVLPSKDGFVIQDGAVFWPAPGQDGSGLISVSDHRPVYLDLEFQATVDELVRQLSIERIGDQVILTWFAEAEAIYGIEMNPDLDPENWTSVMDPNIEVIDGIATAAFAISDDSGFLRVTVVPR